jgi:glyoxylase-like metal-dependent hydrolase (beta-lactamase superfamily II)
LQTFAVTKAFNAARAGIPPHHWSGFRHEFCHFPKGVLMKIFFVFAANIAFAGTTAAHEFKSLDELMAGWGIDFATREITVETLEPGLHVLFGAGGNVLVSIGDQGTLMVDSQFAEMLPKIRQAIHELGGDGIDFTINTHWHFDHANGNPMLGREGTWLVAQENSRRMMAGTHDIHFVDVSYRQPPYPDEALPVITFADRMTFYFNGRRIDLIHTGAAHTTGDTAVIFRDGNVVHMGDVFNARYPFIDTGNGGDLEGMIEFCRAVLDRIDDKTRVIPGHGPVMDFAALQSYTNMLEDVRKRLLVLIDRGLSLDEVMEEKPTADYDGRFGNPQLFLAKAYMSLSR